MVTEIQAYNAAIHEISIDFPGHEVAVMCDGGDKYWFIFDGSNGEAFGTMIYVDKKSGKANKIDFMTALIDYPDLDDCPKIDFREFAKRAS